MGAIVYLKTDFEQRERIVTGFEVRPNGLLYRLSLGWEETPHYDIEISEEKNHVITTT